MDTVKLLAEAEATMREWWSHDMLKFGEHPACYPRRAQTDRRRLIDEMAVTVEHLLLALRKAQTEIAAAEVTERSLAEYEGSDLAKLRVELICVRRERDDLRARAEAAELDRDDLFTRLREIIGIANDDDGPPTNEWDRGDPAQAVGVLRAEVERLRRGVEHFLSMPRGYEDAIWRGCTYLLAGREWDGSEPRTEVG